MPDLVQAIQGAVLALADHPVLIPALLAVGLAGMVRGFAGFGGAMLFMPFATILFDPRLAVVAFFIIDTSITLPLVANALRHWDWRTVIPAPSGRGRVSGLELICWRQPTRLRCAGPSASSSF